MTTYPKRIISARTKLGLRTSSASRLWGFAYATLYAWEAGLRNPAGLYKDKLEKILRKIENGHLRAKN